MVLVARSRSPLNLLTSWSDRKKARAIAALFIVRMSLSWTENPRDLRFARTQAGIRSWGSLKIRERVTATTPSNSGNANDS